MGTFHDEVIVSDVQKKRRAGVLAKEVTMKSSKGTPGEVATHSLKPADAYIIRIRKPWTARVLVLVNNSFHTPAVCNDRAIP